MAAQSELLKELYLFTLSRYRERGKPVPTKELYEFLRHRIRSQDIPRLIQVAERWYHITRVNEDIWIPLPRYWHIPVPPSSTLIYHPPPPVIKAMPAMHGTHASPYSKN